jgi:hypothetical protein
LIGFPKWVIISERLCSDLFVTDFLAENCSWVIQAYFFPWLSTTPSHGLPARCQQINNVSAIKITDFALLSLTSSLRCQSGWLFYVMGNPQAIESAPPGFCGPEHSFAKSNIHRRDV